MLITLLIALHMTRVVAVIPTVQTAPADFLAFLDTVDAAQKKLQSGDAGTYKDLWLHSDYVTTTQTRGDLGYVVQTEHIQFVAPGQTAKSTRMYRVTMIFEHTATGWRVIHRHADAQATKQPARE